MEDDLIESLGPILYAISKSFSTYKKAYGEAVTVYKTLTGIDVSPDKEAISKIVSSVMGEVEKMPKLSASDFLKKYQQTSFLFSVLKKFLG